MKKKILIYFVLCIAIEKFTNCTTTAQDAVIEKKVLNLELKVLELQTENTRLKLENLNLREENELKNCSILAEQAENISESLHTLWQDVQPFKNYLNQLFKNSSNKNSLQHKSSPLKNSLEYENKLPKSCKDEAVTKSGITRIQLPLASIDSFLVMCDAQLENGGWLVIQRRFDGGTDFYRTWTEYRQGFGKLEGEFFIGLEKLHQLTTFEPYELLVELEDFDKKVAYAKYDRFVIDREGKNYALKELGTYSGDAGDALSYHKSQNFSTYDRDNDQLAGNCATIYSGAWWYNGCHFCNLNGLYVNGGVNEAQNGLIWRTFRGIKYSYKSVRMMIRATNV